MQWGRYRLEVWHPRLKEPERREGKSGIDLQRAVEGAVKLAGETESRLQLVREALRERGLLLRNAPHLVRVLPFLIPILTRDGIIDRRSFRGGESSIECFAISAFEEPRAIAPTS